MQSADITIYGKTDCNRCNLAKWLIPESSYKDHKALYDRYSIDEANEIISASNGELPIIVIERTGVGRLVLGPSGATKANECKDGVCSI